MNRRFFLKSIPLFATAASAKATQDVEAETETEEKWLEFADQMPKHTTDFLLKNKATGDIRLGVITKYKGWEKDEYWESFFLTHKVKKTDFRSEVVDEENWKEWSWGYDD